MIFRLQKNNANIRFSLHLSSFCNIHLNFSLTFVRIKLKCYNFENVLLVMSFIFFVENSKKYPHLYLKDEGKNVICTLQKNSKTSHSSSSNISQAWLILQETSRPKARSLAMRLAFARLLASSTTIPESLYEI